MAANWFNVGGAALGMLGSLAGGNMSYNRQKNLMKRQYQYQTMLNQQGHDLQFDMWNKTNYGAQVGHMRDAGLNPGMMYGMGGAGGTTTGSQGGGSAAGGPGAAQYMDMQNSLLGAQLEKLISEKENIDADTENKGALTELAWSEKYIKDITGSLTYDSLLANINKLNREAENLKQNYDLTRDQYNALVEQASADVVKTYSEIELNKELKGLNEEQKNAISVKLQQEWTKLDIDQQNADTNRYDSITKQDSVKVQNFRAKIELYKTRIMKELGEMGIDVQRAQTIVNGLTGLLGAFAPKGGGMTINNNLPQ